jgi:hypothetical protein
MTIGPPPCITRQTVQWQIIGPIPVLFFKNTTIFDDLESTFYV